MRFDCPMCGLLLKDDIEHATPLASACPSCGRGPLRLVGRGDSPAVGDANWYRCGSCRRLAMRRRGEVVSTQPRTGFAEFTEFDD